MLSTSVPTAPASPLTLLAKRRATLCPIGIQVGFGLPVPCFVVNLPRLRKEVSELSSDCITSRITLRSAPPTGHIERMNDTGWRSTVSRKRSARSGPPSIICPESGKREYWPEPYFTTSTWVVGSRSLETPIAQPFAQYVLLR